MNIGDKVRFLNSVGGGIVTAFHGKDQVLVEDENGFDVPVLIAECVVVGEDDRRMESKEPEPYVPPVKAVVSPTQDEVKPAKQVIYPVVETPQGERLNISLGFLPVEPKAFMQTPFEAYLVNESNYFLFINYMSCKNNSWTSRYHGIIEPDTKIFIEEFEKAGLNELEHICVQMVAFKEGKSYSLKNALSVEMRLDTVKFYKLHCFTKNDFFDEDALIVPLVVNDVPEKQMLVSATDIQEAMYDRKKEERRTPQPAVKISKPENNVIEIDLHINQLMETTSGMNNADMLNYQLSKFHEVMNANSGKKGQKIVFIHGKGGGVLRTALEKELKTTYKNQCRFQDASFREYGYGATMVVIG
ncbi:MAG: DUF2027 domain-containing protein [Tannerella sp.]|nr:DUF2027 domain-containing protein [Tannerella sp.]